MPGFLFGLVLYIEGLYFTGVLFITVFELSSFNFIDLSPKNFVGVLDLSWLTPFGLSFAFKKDGPVISDDCILLA